MVIADSTSKVRRISHTGTVQYPSQPDDGPPPPRQQQQQQQHEYQSMPHSYTTPNELVNAPLQLQRGQQENFVTPARNPYASGQPTISQQQRRHQDDCHDAPQTCQKQQERYGTLRIRHAPEGCQAPNRPRYKRAFEEERPTTTTVAVVPKRVSPYNEKETTWQQNSMPKPQPVSSGAVPLYTTSYQQQQPAVPMPVSAFSMLTPTRQKSRDAKTLYLIPPPLQHHHNHLSNRNFSTGAHDWLRLDPGITELAGEAGSGKSQIAMSLCVQAVLQQQQGPRTQTIYHPSQTVSDGTNSTSTTKAIYISLSGGPASLARIAHRMQQMSETQQQQQQQQPGGIPDNTSVASSTNSSESILSQILTHSVRNHDDLFTLLRDDLPLRLQQQRTSHPNKQDSNSHAPSPHPVALIVLDSIADLFRLGNGDGAVIDTNQTAISHRSFLLFEISSILRSLSDQYGIPILVINQVSNDMNSKSTVPTLGLSWANCTNTSFLVRRQSTYHSDSSTSSSLSATGKGDNQGQQVRGQPSTTAKAPATRGRQIFLTRSSKHAVNRRVVFDIETRGVVWR